MPFNFGEVPFNPGDTALVNCLATKGDLPLDISWTFSSETIDPTLQRGITTTTLNPRISVLTINSVSANHQGNYTCIVKNAAGRAEYAATLVVNGTSIHDNAMLHNGSLLRELTSLNSTSNGAVSLQSPFYTLILSLIANIAWLDESNPNFYGSFQYCLA